MSLIVIFLIISLPAFSQEPEDIIIERDSVILKGKFYKAAGDHNMPVVILLQGSPGNISGKIIEQVRDQCNNIQLQV